MSRVRKKIGDNLDLFADAPSRSSVHQPLAERMRPRSLEEFAGQTEMVGEKAWFRKVTSRGFLPSMVFWGPPGTGKTTLALLLAELASVRFVPYSAVTGSVPELRDLLREARDRRLQLEERTLLFLDEIHRFNKSQQDILLPFVEAGDITLVGATTENPAFYLNGALNSRLRVVVFSPLGLEELVALLERALSDSERGLSSSAYRVEGSPLVADSDLLLEIARTSDGDARRALCTLELVAQTALAAGQSKLNKELAAGAVAQGVLRHDKKGDDHYDLASALIKSLRGSDPDAALYWMMRLLEAGDDPLFVSRRFLIFASEDIGNADPQALVLAVSTDAAFRRLGMPEGIYPLAQCCTYLASAPKSNASNLGWHRAREAVHRHGSLPVPKHLRNAPTGLAKAMKHGEGYRYAHDEGGFFGGPNLSTGGLDRVPFLRASAWAGEKTEIIFF